MTGSEESVASSASLLIPERGGDRVLAIETPDGLAPPRVDLGERWWPGHTAGALEAVAQQLSLNAVVVDARRVAPRHFAIRTESPPPGWMPPAGAQWVGLRELAASSVGTFVDTPDGTEAWLRPGWAAGAMAWIDEQLGSIGYARTGSPRQLKHWSIGAVMRIPAEPADVVFKEVPSYFAHEGPVISVLDGLAGAGVPKLLARGDRRSLFELFEESRPDSAGDPEFDGALREYARLQQSSIDHAGELRAAGASLRTPDVLAADLRALLDRDDLLGHNPRDLDPVGLPRQVDALVSRCDALSALGMSLTIVHGDFHQWNVTRAGAGGWLIYDWTDSSLAHPFWDLSPWLWHIDDLAARARARDSYLDAWRPMYGDLVDEAWRLCEPLACANYAFDYVMLSDATGAVNLTEWASAIGVWLRRGIDALGSVA